MEQVVSAKQSGEEGLRKAPEDSTIVGSHVDYGVYDSKIDVGVDYVKGGDTLFQFRTIDVKAKDTSDLKTRKLN